MDKRHMDRQAMIGSFTFDTANMCAEDIEALEQIAATTSNANEPFARLVLRLLLWGLVERVGDRYRVTEGGRAAMHEIERRRKAALPS